MRSALAMTLILWAGCGGDDGGIIVDAGPACLVTIGVTPVAPEAPATVSAEATISGDAAGIVAVTWQIDGPNGAVTPTSAAADGSAIDFAADDPGVYQLRAIATVGVLTCDDGQLDLNVPLAGAMTREIRLRYTPLPSQPAPPQDDPAPVIVVGRSPQQLAPRTLDGGTVVAAGLTGPGGPLAAYLRLDRLGAPVRWPTEFFAAADGSYSTRLGAGVYDLLVVPYDEGAPPMLLTSQSVGDVGSGYAVDAGDPVGGVLHAADGVTPIVGARVAMTAGQLPAVITTTAADGTFATRVRMSAGDVAITIIPPDGSGYAGLTLGPIGGVTPGSQLAFRLAGTSAVAVDATVTAADGAPLAADATFVATGLGVTGSLSIEGGPPISVPASLRVTVSSDAAGVIAVMLPAASYDVVIEPRVAASGQALTARTIDVSGGPLALATEATTAYVVHVRDEAGVGVAGARVTAVSRGLAAVGGGATLDGQTDAQGMLSLPLSLGVTYDMTIDPPRSAGLARERLTVDGAGGSLLVPLVAALPISGTLLFGAGAGQAGVRVAAYCVACSPGEDPTVPLAETVTGAGGVFELLVPDPGLAP